MGWGSAPHPRTGTPRPSLTVLCVLPVLGLSPLCAHVRLTADDKLYYRDLTDKEVRSAAAAGAGGPGSEIQGSEPLPSQPPTQEGAE